MGKISFDRGTTYSITFNYLRNGVATTLVGAKVRFTIKSTQYDADTADSTAIVTKNITNGSSGGVATITINPSDTATVTPGKYYYDIKVDVTNDGTTVYECDSGTVILGGSPTNRLS